MIKKRHRQKPLPSMSSWYFHLLVHIITKLTKSAPITEKTQRHACWIHDALLKGAIQLKVVQHITWVFISPISRSLSLCISTLLLFDICSPDCSSVRQPGFKALVCQQHDTQIQSSLSTEPALPEIETETMSEQKRSTKSNITWKGPERNEWISLILRLWACFFGVFACGSKILTEWLSDVLIWFAHDLLALLNEHKLHFISLPQSPSIFFWLQFYIYNCVFVFVCMLAILWVALSVCVRRRTSLEQTTHFLEWA